MKLLILTQAVDKNHPVLGFFLGWISEFARHCEQVTVVCLWQGEFDLPSNVKVLSLGKEEFAESSVGSWSRRWQFVWRFYKHIWQQRNRYDNVFVHMNQVYVILGGLAWRLLGKKIGLWYAHGKVSASLKLAEKLTHHIFTSTKEGCRLPSGKIRIVGQGIDVTRFSTDRSVPESAALGNRNFTVITVGRISRIKDYQTLIKAASLLSRTGSNPGFRVKIVGGASSQDERDYLSELEKTVAESALSQVVEFVGPVKNSDLILHLQGADLSVNMSYTGSLDKVILEAMASGLPVLTCNEAAAEVLTGSHADLMFGKGAADELAHKISRLMAMDAKERNALGRELKAIVESGHSLDGLINKIIANYDV